MTTSKYQIYAKASWGETQSLKIPIVVTRYNFIANLAKALAFIWRSVYTATATLMLINTFVFTSTDTVRIARCCATTSPTIAGCRAMAIVAEAPRQRPQGSGES